MKAAESARASARGLIRRALISDSGMRLKGWLQELAWRVKGRRITNPPLPAPVRSLLFICQGNICRSPFAEGLARRLLAGTTHASVRCASAGLKTKQASAPPLEACDAASAFQVALAGRRPVPFTEDLAQQFDAIVVMEACQADTLRASHPALAQKVFVLPLFGNSGAKAIDRYNIEDPFGHSRAVFDACYRRIELDVHALLGAAKLLPNDRRPTPSRASDRGLESPRR
jgi:protein-tyrosine phosphatase